MVYDEGKCFKASRVLNKISAIRSEIHRREQQFSWVIKARPNQLPPPGDWLYWLILAGRGFGKTQTGSGTIQMWVKQGLHKKIALISRTISEARSIMVEGVSGILNMYHQADRPIFKPSQKIIRWKSGATAQLFSGDVVDGLRGPQFDLVWIDELCKFKYPDELWDQMTLGLRLGPHPRCIITTTPRPIPLLKRIMDHDKTVITRGSTFDNTDHLSPAFLNEMNDRFQSHPLGRQELYGEIVDTGQSLFKREWIIHEHIAIQNKTLTVMAIDPAMTYHENSDETGMVICSRLKDGRMAVIEDLSGRMPPEAWIQKIHDAYHALQVHYVIIETNQGGDLIEHMIRQLDPSIMIKKIHTHTSKAIRFAPVIEMYMNKRVIHMKNFPELEGQMCQALPKHRSPDRLDALTYALTHLSLIKKQVSLWSP